MIKSLKKRDCGTAFGYHFSYEKLNAGQTRIFLFFVQEPNFGRKRSIIGQQNKICVGIN